MLKWEYCILSGVETSIRRKLSLALTFSNDAQENKNLEVELDRGRSEETFATSFLGELGHEGWELIAFNRAASRFEAVLKRPLEFSETRRVLGSESNGALAG